MAGLNYIQVEIFTMVTIFLGTHSCTMEGPDFKCSKLGRCLFPNHARLVWVHTYHWSKYYLSISNESNGPILITCLFSSTNFVIRDFRHSNFLLQGWILFGFIFKIFKGDQLSNRKKKVKRKKKLRKKYSILTDGWSLKWAHSSNRKWNKSCWSHKEFSQWWTGEFDCLQ